MRKLYATIVVFMAVMAVTTKAAPPEINWTKQAPIPNPMPAPPGSDLILTPDLTFVADYNKEFMILPSPKGYVTISPKLTGPFKLKARFVDKPNVPEWREFKGAFGYTVDAIPFDDDKKSVKIELLVIESGNNNPDDVLRIALTIQNGTKPQPPPVPPNPGPTPEPTPKGEPGWIVIIEETSQRGLNDPNSDLNYWKGLKEKGHSYRFYDKDAKDIPAGYYTPGETLPKIIIASKGGDLLYSGTRPSTTTGITELVTKYTGVK